MHSGFREKRAWHSTMMNRLPVNTVTIMPMVHQTEKGNKHNYLKICCMSLKVGGIDIMTLFLIRYSSRIWTTKRLFALNKMTRSSTNFWDWRQSKNTK